MAGGESNFRSGVVREGCPEVVTYEIKMTVTHMKKGLGRALQIRENTWAMA